MKCIIAIIATATACPYLDGQRNGELPTVPHHRHLQQDRFSGTAVQTIASAQEELRGFIRIDDDYGPQLVRLGFHDCVGGSCDGCVDLTNPDNNGLQEIIQRLEPFVDFYSTVLTRADVWALGALTAAEELQDGSGARRYEFRYYGRESCNDPTGGPHRVLPGSHLVTSELLDFFATTFDFSEQETVAIMGAHTL